MGELTHLVLGLMRERGFPIAQRITAAGGHPLEVIVVVAVTLRAVADGLEDPESDWLD